MVHLPDALVTAPASAQVPPPDTLTEAPTTTPPLAAFAVISTFPVVGCTTITTAVAVSRVTVTVADVVT